MGDINNPSFFLLEVNLLSAKLLDLKNYSCIINIQRKNKAIKFMSRCFEYFFTRTAVGELDVDDIGNCVIEAGDDIGQLYYLKIDTKLGWSRIFEYGPCTPDFSELPKSVICNFDREEFNEIKLYNRIKLFLNAPKRNITQARLIEDEELFDSVIDIIEYMKNPENF